jgi:hypothetical protein
LQGRHQGSQQTGTKQTGFHFCKGYAWFDGCKVRQPGATSIEQKRHLKAALQAYIPGGQEFLVE